MSKKLKPEHTVNSDSLYVDIPWTLFSLSHAKYKQQQWEEFLLETMCTDNHDKVMEKKCLPSTENERPLLWWGRDYILPSSHEKKSHSISPNMKRTDTLGIMHRGGFGSSPKFSPWQAEFGKKKVDACKVEKGAWTLLFIG